MMLLPYGFQNQRVIICKVIRDIEKELAELNFQKNVLTNAFNSLQSDDDDLKESKSILSSETNRILQEKTIKR